MDTLILNRVIIFKMGCCNLKNKDKHNKIEDILEKLNSIRIKDASKLIPEIMKVQNDLQKRNNLLSPTYRANKDLADSNRSTTQMPPLELSSINSQ